MPTLSPCFLTNLPLRPRASAQIPFAKMQKRRGLRDSLSDNCKANIPIVMILAKCANASFHLDDILDPNAHKSPAVSVVKKYNIQDIKP